MVDLTFPSGQKVQIDGKDVIRIRATLAQEPEGNSLVTWLQTAFFDEDAASIAKMVVVELPTLTSLKSPQLGSIWFNGAKAIGPYWVRPTDRGDGVNSSFQIGNKIQYVSNLPQEVADVIKKAGGKVLPIRDDGMMTTIIEEAKSWMRDLKAWDSGLVDTK